jgi:hypothetical protein
MLAVDGFLHDHGLHRDDLGAIRQIGVRYSREQPMSRQTREWLSELGQKFQA